MTYLLVSVHAGETARVASFAACRGCGLDLLLRAIYQLVQCRQMLYVALVQLAYRLAKLPGLLSAMLRRVGVERVNWMRFSKKLYE